MSRDITSATITPGQIVFRPCFLYEFSSASNFLSNDTKYGHIWTLYFFSTIMTSYRKWRHFRYLTKNTPDGFWKQGSSRIISQKSLYFTNFARIFCVFPCLNATRIFGLHDTRCTYPLPFSNHRQLLTRQLLTATIAHCDNCSLAWILLLFARGINTIFFELTWCITRLKHNS